MINGIFCSCIKKIYVCVNKIDKKKKELKKLEKKNIKLYDVVFQGYIEYI